MSARKKYLGDSVYVDRDEFGGIVLTTENGYGPSNTIVLEPEVLAALVAFAGEDEARALAAIKADCKCCLDCCPEACGSVFAGGPCEKICRCAERDAEQERNAARVDGDDRDDIDSPSGDF